MGGVAGSNDNSGTILNSYYHGCNAGVGGTGALQTGIIPFVKITDNPLGVGKTTTITEDAATALSGNDKLGTDFSITFSVITSYSIHYTKLYEHCFL